jgi:hypothetical protein
MDTENWPPQLQFVFIAMMKSAIYFKEMGREKKFFCEFAKEIWVSMEMSDFDELKEIIEEKIRKDLEPFVKSYMENEKKSNKK